MQVLVLSVPPTCLSAHTQCTPHRLHQLSYAPRSRKGSFTDLPTGYICLHASTSLNEGKRLETLPDMGTTGFFMTPCNFQYARSYSTAEDNKKLAWLMLAAQCRPVTKSLGGGTLLKDTSNGDKYFCLHTISLSNNTSIQTNTLFILFCFI